MLLEAAARPSLQRLSWQFRWVLSCLQCVVRASDLVLPLSSLPRALLMSLWINLPTRFPTILLPSRITPLGTARRSSLNGARQSYLIRVRKSRSSPRPP